MKIKIVVAAMILVVSCALVVVPVLSQRRRTQSPKPKPTPVSPSPTPAPLGKLSVEAGVVFKNGDTKPVARTIFYLLDENVLGAKYDSCAKDPLCLGSFIANVRAHEQLDRDTGRPFTSLEDQLAPHVVATATTSFDGRAVFEPLSPGKRFLYGAFRVGDQYIAWNVEVEIVSGRELDLILDNSGAEVRRK